MTSRLTKNRLMMNIKVWTLIKGFDFAQYCACQAIRVIHEETMITMMTMMTTKTTTTTTKITLVIKIIKLQHYVCRVSRCPRM